MILIASSGVAEDRDPSHRIPPDHFDQIPREAKAFRLELQISTAVRQGDNSERGAHLAPVTCRSFVKLRGLAPGQIYERRRLETAGGYLGSVQRCGIEIPSSIAQNVDACFLDSTSSSNARQADEYSVSVSYSNGEILFNLKILSRAAQASHFVFNYYCQLKQSRI